MEETWTVLMKAAAWAQDADEVMAVLSSGADANEKNGRGETALMIAAEYSCCPDVIRALMRAGAD